MAEEMSPHDEMVTVRMPMWAWGGITNGIEKWAGRHWDETGIMHPIEFVELPPSWHVEVEDGKRYLLRD